MIVITPSPVKGTVDSLVLAVEGVLRSHRKCHHKLRNKTTGYEYVCHRSATYSLRLSATESKFACNTCLPLSADANEMDTAPHGGFMRDLADGVEGALDTTGAELRASANALLDYVDAGGEGTGGCARCFAERWWHGAEAQAALSELYLERGRTQTWPPCVFSSSGGEA